MSPFAIAFNKYRLSRGVRQYELGERLGVKQRYLSSLETGTKNPPSESFILKIAAALDLNGEETEALMQSAKESQRKYQLPDDAPVELYQMVYQLWKVMDVLATDQIECIGRVIDMAAQAKNDYRRPVERIKRRRREESRM